MAVVGRSLLYLGLLVALYGICASIYGARTGRREWVDSGRRSVYALAGIMTIAFVILEAAFLRSDFSFNVVAEHSSTTTPTFYKAAAAWSSQEGALLLVFCPFFVPRAAFSPNPFATTGNPPPEGAGLAPLLLHPSMMIHPPML